MKKKREGKQSPFYPNSLGFSRQSLASVAQEETGNICCAVVRMRHCAASELGLKAQIPLF